MTSDSPCRPRHVSFRLSTFDFRLFLLRLTLGAKIFAGFLAVLLTFGAVSGFSVWRIAQVGDRLRSNQAHLALAQPVNDLDSRQEQFGRVVASRKERTTY